MWTLPCRTTRWTNEQCRPPLHLQGAQRCLTQACPTSLYAFLNRLPMRSAAKAQRQQRALPVEKNAITDSKVGKRNIELPAGFSTTGKMPSKQASAYKRQRLMHVGFLQRLACNRHHPLGSAVCACTLSCSGTRRRSTQAPSTTVHPHAWTAHSGQRTGPPR